MTSEALINHLNNRANCCHAPNNRYCAVGREHWLEDKAAYIESLKSKADRKDVRDLLFANAPEWAAEVERRVVQRFDTRRRGEARAQSIMGVSV